MVGLWDSSTAEDGSIIESFTIITTYANELMVEIHKPKRMPVILDPENPATLLSANNDQAWELVKPYPSELMSAYRVSDYVKRPIHNDELCIEPLSSESDT